MRLQFFVLFQKLWKTHRDLYSCSLSAFINWGKNQKGRTPPPPLKPACFFATPFFRRDERGKGEPKGCTNPPVQHHAYCRSNSSSNNNNWTKRRASKCNPRARVEHLYKKVTLNAIYWPRSLSKRHDESRTFRQNYVGFVHKWRHLWTSSTSYLNI